jgi:hypothetical protein
MVARNVDQTITLKHNGRHVPLGRGAAEKVWVSALPLLQSELQLDEQQQPVSPAPL